MKRFLLPVFVLAATAFAAEFQRGTLLDVKSTRGGRVVHSHGNLATVPHDRYLLSVQLGDTVYTGEYKADGRWAYEPADLPVGSTVEAKIEGGHMILRRPNGKELKTTIKRRTHRAAAPHAR